MPELRIASFCSSYGRIWDGPKTSYHLCSNHQRQTFVVYVSPEEGPVIACPKCLEEHLAFGIKDADIVDVTVPTRCESCGIEHNLKTCIHCEKCVCPLHRVDEACDDCVAWGSQFGF